MQAFRVQQLKKQRGITLIEVLLVFAVASAIVVMSVKQYEMFRSDKDIQQVRYNVDMLAQAAANYYWVNCRGQMDPNTNKIVPGTLSPYNATPPSPGTPFLINTTTDLINTGYLKVPLTLGGNPYVTDYVVQFNETLIKQYRLGCDDADCNTSSQKQIGTLVSFQIQISVLLSDPTKADAYKNILGANCLSSLSGTTVLPCSQAPATANTYAVFERSAAYPTPAASSALSGNQVNIQAFSQQQTVNPIGNLLSSDHTTEYQYFLCSGY